MMPLGMARVGEERHPQDYRPGRGSPAPGEMGFVVGEEVRVVCELSGNLILSVKDSRVALDKSMAMRILV